MSEPEMNDDMQGDAPPEAPEIEKPEVEMPEGDPIPESEDDDAEA